MVRGGSTDVSEGNRAVLRLFFSTIQKELIHDCLYLNGMNVNTRKAQVSEAFIFPMWLSLRLVNLNTAALTCVSVFRGFSA